MTRFYVAVAVVAACLGTSDAYCTNGCSGHGTCQSAIGLKDTCTCYTHLDAGVEVPAWTGADCSLRTCPKAGAWAASASGNDDHVSTTVECANRGTCDRASGQCICAAGYTGAACEREVCPNDCNGHGKCETQSQLADDVSHNADDGVSSLYYAIPDSANDCANCVGTKNTGAMYDSAWDSKRSSGCNCDAGFRGPDCSLKECPSGADPLGGSGASKGRPCSGRGTCNTETGTCTCYMGYYGNKCHMQTVLA